MLHRIPGSIRKITPSNIGEYISAALASGSSVNLASFLTAYNITSVQLPAGDWDVSGQIIMNSLSGSGTMWWIQAALNTVSATMPSAGTMALNGLSVQTLLNNLPNNSFGVGVGPHRMVFTAPTVVYLIAAWNGSGSGAAAAYGTLRARRAK
jgi:hypothetical protein